MCWEMSLGASIDTNGMYWLNWLKRRKDAYDVGKYVRASKINYFDAVQIARQNQVPEGAAAPME